MGHFGGLKWGHFGGPKRGQNRGPCFGGPRTENQAQIIKRSMANDWGPGIWGPPGQGLAKTWIHLDVYKREDRPRSREVQTPGWSKMGCLSIGRC